MAVDVKHMGMVFCPESAQHRWIAQVDQVLLLKCGTGWAIMCTRSRGCVGTRVRLFVRACMRACVRAWCVCNIR